jgi:hypothetical protein
MTAYLIVRAEVPEADREAFDHWYQTEHLPDAKAAFNATAASRGWSAETSGVHIAFYQFPSLLQAQSIASSAEIETLIAEFDRQWQGRVTRTREVVEIDQSI